MNNKKKKVIIAGAGIAGLATAARLAAKGFDVTVFEQNDYPGGKLGFWQKEGYSFDKGPSLFIQPEIHEELYTYCGKDPADYLPYQPLDVITHYFFNDGTRLNFYPDPERTAAETERVLGVPKEIVLRYLRDADMLYQDVGRIFLDEPIHQLKTWLSPRIPKALRRVKIAHLTQSMHEYNRKHLPHPRLVQLFDRYATYNGSNPYLAPAMLTMISHFEITEGTYYPKGGMVSIPRAVYRLGKDLGVHFHFNSKVDQIILENNAAKGVLVDGVRYDADYVVSNNDVYFTYKNLLGDEAAARAVQKQERSTSGYIFYWGIEKQFPQLNLHNILFSENYKEEFDTIFYKKDVYQDPTIYINITSKMEAEHAPEGCENWFVFVNAAAANKEDSERLAPQARAHILRKLERILGEPIEPLIAVEEWLTPGRIEDITGGYMGALYGTASNNRMAAFARHSNSSSKYKGLYFASGTVHPGGGIPLCLRSAKLVSELIEKEV